VTILLHGTDGYRRSQRLRILLEQFLKKYPGVGVRRVDAELDEEPAEKVSEILGSSSLFSPRTLVVLTDALTLTPAQLKPLVEKTASSDTLHLILVADTDKLAKTYARLTQDDVKQEAFPVQTGSDWARFVAREAKVRGMELSKSQLQSITYAFPGDSWGVATELDVLAAMPEEMRVERITETSRTLPQGSPGWFEIRKLGQGSPIQRLVTLARLEASGDAPAKLFAMAAYSVNPVAAARGDVQIKTGGWEHEEALIALAVY
jgi:DNA polymerase III delta subunit